MGADWLVAALMAYYDDDIGLRLPDPSFIHEGSKSWGINEPGRTLNLWWDPPTRGHPGGYRFCAFIHVGEEVFILNDLDVSTDKLRCFAAELWRNMPAATCSTPPKF